MEISLTLNDVLTLEAELNGLYNIQTGELIAEGLLSKELDLIVKYHLEKVVKQAIEHKTEVDKVREELIKKYGKQEGEAFSLPLYINEVKDEEGKTISAEINPNYVKFEEDFAKLLKEKVTIKIKDLSAEDVYRNIKSKTRLRVLNSLLVDIE